MIADFLDFARDVFEASAETKDGSTIGAHKRQLSASAVKYGIELADNELDDGPDPMIPPSGFQFIWGAFVELSSSRQVGFVPNPIAYSDIMAWCLLHRVKFRVWEVELIRRLDSLWLRTMADAEKNKSKETDQEQE